MSDETDEDRRRATEEETKRRNEALQRIARDEARVERRRQEREQNS